MALPHVIAVDFGTSNSCFFTCPHDEIACEAIRFLPYKEYVDTAVLYRPHQDPLVGDTAIEEWGDASNYERKKYVLKVMFKPDIGFSQEARRTAEDFLAGLRILAEKQHIDFRPEDKKVIFGIPSEGGAEFKSHLEEIALRAGYGQIVVIPEPVGAMLYCLWNKSISPSDALKGVLVVDFGGGTCDFSYLQDLEVRHSWGDMELGGRLFDDLFFQWFMEQNPRQNNIQGTGDEYFLHWRECRIAKENFSHSMARNREGSYNCRISDFGRLKNLTWAEFEQRARDYRPSRTFIRYLASMEKPHGQLRLGCRFDLIQWFQDILVAGMKKNGLAREDIGRVVLVGGSCLWPFVPEVISQSLNLDDRRIFRSNQPFSVVAQGLAMRPALGRKLSTAQKRLRDNLDDFLENRVQSLLDKRAALLAEQSMRIIAVALIDKRIIPLIRDYRETGGSIALLEERIKQETARLDKAWLEELLSHNLASHLRQIGNEVQTLAVQWFDEQGVKYHPRPLNKGIGRIEDPDLVVPLQVNSNMGNMIVLTVATLILANLLGGGGIALLMAGPVGLMLGAIIGLLSVFFGKKHVRNIPVPAYATRMLLTEPKMHSIAERAKADLRKRLEVMLDNELADPQGDIRKNLRKYLEQEIESMTIINQLPGF